MPTEQISEINYKLVKEVAENMNCTAETVVNLAIFILGHLDRRATSMWLNRYIREIQKL